MPLFHAERLWAEPNSSINNMHNPYYTQSAAIRGKAKDLLLNGLETLIRKAIYDVGIDGIKEMKDHLTEKYGKDENVKANAKAFNFINWTILRLLAKGDMKIFGLIY